MEWVLYTSLVRGIYFCNSLIILIILTVTDDLTILIWYYTCEISSSRIKCHYLALSLIYKFRLHKFTIRIGGSWVLRGLGDSKVQNFWQVLITIWIWSQEVDFFNLGVRIFRIKWRNTADIFGHSVKSPHLERSKYLMTHLNGVNFTERFPRAEEIVKRIAEY